MTVTPEEHDIEKMIAVADKVFGVSLSRQQALAIFSEYGFASAWAMSEGEDADELLVDYIIQKADLTVHNLHPPEMTVEERSLLQEAAIQRGIATSILRPASEINLDEHYAFPEVEIVRTSR